MKPIFRLSYTYDTERNQHFGRWEVLTARNGTELYDVNFWYEIYNESPERSAEWMALDSLLRAWIAEGRPNTIAPHAPTGNWTTKLFRITQHDLLHVTDMEPVAE